MTMNRTTVIATVLAFLGAALGLASRALMALADGYDRNAPGLWRRAGWALGDAWDFVSGCVAPAIMEGGAWALGRAGRVLGWAYGALVGIACLAGAGIRAVPKIATSIGVGAAKAWEFRREVLAEW